MNCSLYTAIIPIFNTSERGYSIVTAGNGLRPIPLTRNYTPDTCAISMSDSSLSDKSEKGDGEWRLYFALFFAGSYMRSTVLLLRWINSEISQRP